MHLHGEAFDSLLSTDGPERRAIVRSIDSYLDETWAGTRERATTRTQTFSVVEASIWDLQNALTEGRVTSRELVQMYFDRINRHEGTVNAVAALSASAMQDATFLDRERAAGRVRGPLHGIPIAIKDIINTTNMPTTGGGLAFEGFAPL